MVEYDYDLVVIGAGSGGVRASRAAAALGARVAVVERAALGGTCVNAGCVPKKLFVYASQFQREAEDAVGFGWNPGSPEFDWPTLRDNKTKEIARLNDVYRGLLARAGVELVEASAAISDPHTVSVGARSLTAKHILVATGSHPFVPEVVGRELAITSDDAFHLESLPKRLAIVGGGYVALEFAGIFSGLGVAVTLVHRGEQILSGFDRDVRDHLAQELEEGGVRIVHGAHPQRIEHGRVRLSNGESLDSDRVMFATGRHPNTAGLGLEEVGVALGKDGAVLVDRYSCSSVSSIHAVGDVTGRRNLTPVAIAEGQALAQTLFGEARVAVDHRNVPTAVFSQPAVGAVGLTETEARAEYGESVRVYSSRFRPMKHALSGRGERTLIKLVVAGDDERVVGCHMVGSDAGEIIQGFAVAMRAGATKAHFDATVGIHPTIAEEFVLLR